MVISLRKRSAECVCDNICQFSLSQLRTLPPYILNQLHDLLSRRSLPPDASAVIAGLVTWATLHVDWSNFQEILDTFVLGLGACGSLQSLNLNAMKGSREVPTSGALAAVLPKLTLLTEVQLRRCSQVDDSVVDALTSACGHGLRVLNLQDCSACTDASLRFIAERCPGLGSLNLSGCGRVTESGLAILAAAPLAGRLTELQLNRCPGVTDAAVRALVDACPRLAILTFTNCPLLTDESRAALETLRSRGGVRQLFWTVY